VAIQRRSSRPDEPPTADPRAVALRLLTRRDYTTSEIERKLTDHGYETAAIADVIQSLTRAGLLDDRRAGAAHVRTSSRIKGRGKLRIARELEARGIGRALVRELTAGLSADDESAALARVIARMRVPATMDRQTRQRLFGRLLRRGFSPDAVSKALRFRPDDE
jgi:regulatory protein